MINDFRLYALAVVLNFLDVGIAYLVIINFLTPRSKFFIKKSGAKQPPLSLKIIGMGFVYSIIVGYLGYLFQGSLVFRIVGIFVIIGLIKFFTKDKLRNAILVYAIAVLVINVIQAPISTTFFLVWEPNIYVSLGMQLLTITIAYLLYQKIGLHKPFIFIKRSLKSFNLFILGIIVVLISIAMFYLAWNHHHLLASFILGVAIVTLIFYQIVRYIMQLRLKIHNMNNFLKGIEYVLKTEGEQEKLYEHFEKSIKANGFNIPQNKSYEIGKHKENILEFINHESLQRKSQAELITNVIFTRYNNKVPMPVVAQMLGILLDNAFDTKTKKPILINIKVTKPKVEIMISNESDNKSPVEIDQMFGDAYSTKKGKQGYSLSALTQIVERYDGAIIADCDYNEMYKSHYLTFKIEC